MQFFHNPLQPTGVGIDKDQIKALTTWNKLESALRQNSGADQLLFFTELKRLCLVVDASLELWDRAGDPGLIGSSPSKPEPKPLFLRQLSVQLRLLAHMRKLPTEKVEEAVQRSGELAASNTDPNRSSAEILLEQLSFALVLTEDQLLEGIGVQPLAISLVEQQPLFEDLGEHFFRLRQHVGKRREEAERTLSQLLTLHSSKDKSEQ